MPERRNPVVRSGAILRKGGVHTDSVSGQRQRQKLRVDDAIDEWYDDFNDNTDATPGGTDTEFQLAADDRIHHKRHGSKRRSNNGKKKGQSGTAPSSFGWQQITVTRQYHHSQ